MTREEILTIFKRTGALQNGHFALTSGLHSDTYFQCALVLQHPQYAVSLCRLGFERFKEEDIDTVVAPAVGGIVVGYELARQLGALAKFTEREGGVMTLRRGFQIRPGERCLIAEDVITTGGSVREVIDVIHKAGGTVVGLFSIVNRSTKSFDFGVPWYSAIELQAAIYMPEECPLCEQGIPVRKPGSRSLP